MKPTTALVIVNPAAGAGRARQRWAAFESEAQRLSLDVAFTKAPGAARLIAQKAAEKYQRLIAAGGDGTVFEVVSGIMASGATATQFGILPLGTGNDFAEAFGMREDIGALAALLQAQCRLIDVIRISCESNSSTTVSHSLLFAAAGIAAEALRHTTARVKRLFGRRAAYPIGLLRALLAYRSPLMRITVDDRVSEGRFLLACASNTERMGGGIKLAPGARHDDGMLNINLVAGMRLFEAMPQLWRLRHGRHILHPKVRYFAAAAMSFETDGLDVAADGEVIGRTPARFEIRPQALRVLAPIG